MGWSKIKNMDLILNDGSIYGLLQSGFFLSTFKVIGTLTWSNGSEYIFIDYRGLENMYRRDQLQDNIYINLRIMVERKNQLLEERRVTA